MILKKIKENLYLCKLNKSVFMPSQVDTKIRFSGLKPGVYEYEYRLGSEFFERFQNEELQQADVIFNVKMCKKERLLQFEIAARGTVTAQCCRCLGDVEVAIENDAQLTVMLSSDKIDGIRDTDDVDVVEISDSEYEIDLAQWLYEYTVVAMPMRVVHADGQCDPAMTAHIEGEAKEEAKEAGEIDPRWSKLLEL